MTDAVVFWKWVSSNTLALVTGQHVYHWYMNNQADPQKVCTDRLNRVLFGPAL